MGDEGCDDGNDSDGAGCLADCSAPINGWHCVGGSTTSIDVCNEQCGDGVITTSETCEDDDILPGDGCDATCNVEAGWQCDTVEPVSGCVQVCGNGVFDPGETCEDDDLLPGDGCDAYCKEETGWSCDGVLPVSDC